MSIHRGSTNVTDREFLNGMQCLSSCSCASSSEKRIETFRSLPRNFDHHARLLVSTSIDFKAKFRIFHDDRNRLLSLPREEVGQEAFGTKFRRRKSFVRDR